MQSVLCPWGMAVKGFGNGNCVSLDGSNEIVKLSGFWRMVGLAPPPLVVKTGVERMDGLAASAKEFFFAEDMMVGIDGGVLGFFEVSRSNDQHLKKISSDMTRTFSLAIDNSETGQSTLTCTGKIYQWVERGTDMLRCGVDYFTGIYLCVNEDVFPICHPEDCVSADLCDVCISGMF